MLGIRAIEIVNVPLTMICAEANVTNYLRILAIYEAKIAEICNFWTSRPVIQLINPSFQNLTNSFFARRSIDVKSAVTF